MKTAEQVRAELRGLIVGQLVPLSDDELADSAPLVDGVLDSLGISEVAVFIEEEIGRPLRESEEVRSTFASVDAVVSFIEEHR
jgi:acyl carrier protein